MIVLAGPTSAFYRITTHCSIQVYCWGIVIFWFDCLSYFSTLLIGWCAEPKFCWIFESTFDHIINKCSHRRPVQSQLLRLYFFSGQRVGCTTDKCDSNEVACASCSDVMRRRYDGNAAVMRWRCDGDAKAMRGRCNRAQQPRSNRNSNH